MKVTALIPDILVSEVRELTSGKNISDSLIIALKEWTAIQKLRHLKEMVHKEPLVFAEGFSARKVRDVNRRH